MKRGFSILLGETILANAIQYRDCERFQIVCPACNEPVFKAERSLQDDLITHYLSHYRVVDNVASTCELRVNTLHDIDVDRENGIARNQRLVYFLSKLKDELARDSIYARSAEKSHWRLEKSSAFKLLRDVAHEKSRSNSVEHFKICLADYLHNLRIVGWNLRTSFDRSTQTRIARDMWLTVMTPHVRSNFNFLFCHSFLHEIAALRNTLEVDPDASVQRETNRQLEAITEIFNAQPSSAGATLDRLNREFLPPGFSEPRDGQPDYPSTRLSRIAGNVQIGMIGTLMEFPYFELLQRQYGDPSKVYPATTSTFPSSESEIQRMSASQS